MMESCLPICSALVVTPLQARIQQLEQMQPGVRSSSPQPLHGMDAITEATIRASQVSPLLRRSESMGMPPLMPSAEPSIPSPARESKYAYASPQASTDSPQLVRPISPPRASVGSLQDLSGVDVNGAYLEALTKDKGDVHMLRLLTRTGAAWGELTTPVALKLLDAFAGYVEVRRTLNSGWSTLCLTHV